MRSYGGGKLWTVIAVMLAVMMSTLGTICRAHTVSTVPRLIGRQGDSGQGGNVGNDKGSDNSSSPFGLSFLARPF